ncbi:MAG TPA: nuclear transport factor 2 family protein [Solirubrobacteraceae bacterium]|nr:nuclear transport factor 2 family protein [Solirubrobacteraceae bacterium]
MIVAWLDSLRRGDLDAIRDLLAPDVVWRRIPPDVIGHDRDEVLAMLAEHFGGGLPVASALELIAGDRAAVLGVRSDALGQVGDAQLVGQVYNVFALRDGAIVAIEDHRDRGAALKAAAARPPDWA